MSAKKIIQFAFAFPYAFNATKSFQVCLSTVGDDAM
jgi:hypothetical protein